MKHDLNQYLIREYEKLDSEMEQREFVEKNVFPHDGKRKRLFRLLFQTEPDGTGILFRN